MLNKQKHGQITLFVIIGVVILLLIGAVVYFYPSNAASNTRTGEEPTSADAAYKPVSLTEFVEHCMEQVAIEALQNIGRNGGYLSSSYIPARQISPRSYESDAIVATPDTIAYWLYINREGYFSSMKPELYKNAENDNSIQRQLEQYTQERISFCLNNFTQLPQYTIKVLGEPEIQSNIHADRVSLTLTYPLTMLDQGEEQKLSVFKKDIDVHLPAIYQLGSDLVQMELDYQMFESITLNLLAAYGDIDSNIPPLSEMDIFNPKQHIWVRSTVESIIRQDVLAFMQLLQIENTKNYNPVLLDENQTEEYLLQQGIYNSFNLNLNRTYPLNARFFYPDSPIALSIDEKELIRPKSLLPDVFILKLVGFSMNDYSFDYDLTYPLVAVIEDPDAFHGKGYVFQAGYEVNIQNSAPVSGTFVPRGPSALAGVPIDQENLLVNKTISIRAKDAYTQKLMEGVDIHYTCGQRVFLGAIVAQGEQTVLERSLPSCLFGGFVEFSKEGYASVFVPFNNAEDNPENTVGAQLWPITKKAFTIKKRLVSSPGNVLELGADEEVFLTFTKVKATEEEEDFPTIGFFLYHPQNSSLQNNIEEQKRLLRQAYDEGSLDEETYKGLIEDMQATVSSLDAGAKQESVVELIPGDYTVSAYLVFNGNITLPQEEKSVCAGAEVAGNCVGEEKKIVLPAQSLTSFPSGGVSINVTITPEDLYQRGNLTIYVLDNGVPKTWDELNLGFDAEEASLEYAVYVRPVFS